MSCETAVELQMLGENPPAERKRPRLWLWAIVCFWVMPGIGLALTMVRGFAQMESGEVVTGSLIDPFLAYAWLVFSIAGVVMFLPILWRVVKGVEEGEEQNAE